MGSAVGSVHDERATAQQHAGERQSGTGLSRRKNDAIDAAAAASVAALHGNANGVEVEDATAALALLDERRTSLVTQWTRLVNQLHALLRDLTPGGAPTQLTGTAPQTARPRPD